jgi:peroxiredoxin
MTYSTQRSLRAVLFIALALCILHTNAQSPVIRRTLDSLESFRNFSYHSLLKQKEFSDTMIFDNKDLFVKAPGDKNFGYLFSLESKVNPNGFFTTKFYNGRNIVFLDPSDSTYLIQNSDASALEGTLIARLRWVNTYAEKNPSHMASAPDTTIDGKDCKHLTVNTYDAIINHKHLYTRIHVFIDKSTALPTRILYLSKNRNIGDGITNYYAAVSYSNYRFDQPGIDLAAAVVPAGFHPPVKQPAMPALLSPGQSAPDWTLATGDGKRLSLPQLKGRVVVMDFFFIGCYSCMEALKPLEDLYAKYGSQQVVFVSLTDRDNKASVAKFSAAYHINYPVFTDASLVVSSYHVKEFPTFYFIDKHGRVARVMEGYSDSFEKDAAAIIDTLSKN